jgi:hypothetical protein
MRLAAIVVLSAYVGSSPVGCAGQPIDSGPYPDQSVRASRVFAGPGQYPPTSFAAYGILAFPARATSADHDRHMMFCTAYMARLPAASELAVPVSQQMATVWPLDDDRFPTFEREFACRTAVERYGLVIALQAIREARLSNVDRRGPFLLAWSPAGDKGKPDALVLKMDLSDVTTPEEAARVFARWAVEIEGDPSKWRMGWSGVSLRDMLRRFVDARGNGLLELIGSSQ